MEQGVWLFQPESVRVNYSPVSDLHHEIGVVDDRRILREILVSDDVLQKPLWNQMFIR